MKARNLFAFMGVALAVIALQAALPAHAGPKEDCGAEISESDDDDFFFDGPDEAEVDKKRAACTTLIKAADTPAQERAWAYVERAKVYDSEVHGEAELKQAFDDAGKALELRPDHADAYLVRAELHQIAKRSDEALADVNKAIELKPEAASYNIRGWIHKSNIWPAGDRSRYQAAIADYSKAIELDPKDTDHYEARIAVYEEFREYAAIIADYTALLALEPGSYYYYAMRGHAHRDAGDYAKALADHTKALEIELKEYADDAYEKATAYSRRAKTHEWFGKYAAAVADRSKAIEIDPDDLNYEARGETHVKAGNHAAAIADFGKAIELDPKYTVPLYQRGNLYLKLGQLDKALADYDTIIKLDPDDATMGYRGRGWVHQRREQWRLAHEMFSKAIKITDTAYDYVVRGEIYEALGERANAIADYRTAIERLEDSFKNRLSLEENTIYQDARKRLEALGETP